MADIMLEFLSTLNFAAEPESVAFLEAACFGPCDCEAAATKTAIAPKIAIRIETIFASGK